MGIGYWVLGDEEAGNRLIDAICCDNYNRTYITAINL
jgi:hypothetical protein